MDLNCTIFSEWLILSGPAPSTRIANPHTVKLALELLDRAAERTSATAPALPNSGAVAPFTNEGGETMRRIQAMVMAMVVTAGAGACEIKPGSDCKNADLMGANLVDADLRGASLRGANLVDANLQGARLRGAYLVDANLVDANLEQADLQGAKLSGANFSGANLAGANFRATNLFNAHFAGADLADADFSGAQSCPDFIRERCN